MLCRITSILVFVRNFSRKICETTLKIRYRKGSPVKFFEVSYYQKNFQLSTVHKSEDRGGMKMSYDFFVYISRSKGTTWFSLTFFDTSLPILPDVEVILFKITQPLAFYFNKRLSTEMIEIILLTLFCVVACVSNSDWSMSWSVTFLSQIFWGPWRYKGARNKLKLLTVSDIIQTFHVHINKICCQFKTLYFQVCPNEMFGWCQKFFFQLKNSHRISKQLQSVSK